MAKTIVTHKKPHLDEVAAIWLLQRYHPEYKRFRLRFIPQTSPLATGQVTPKRAELLIGVGRGEFDEHSGLADETATTLIYKFLGRSNHLPKENYKRRALDALVEHVKLGDLGKLLTVPHLIREFLPDVILAGWNRRHGDARSVRKGIDLLESLYIELRTWEETAATWKEKVEFRVGSLKAAAISGESLSHIERHAYDEGYDFVVSVDTRHGRRQFRGAAESRVDFTPAYNFLINTDKEAHWYLHHSGKILISAGSTHSSLDLDSLVEVAKKVL